LAVQAYGEAEFWLSGGKVILIFIVFAFTFVSMVGGNPRHWAYGFYYWQDPGAFAEYTGSGSTGNLARFEGFLQSLWSAAFTVVGPEYIGMVAAEAQRPSVYIKNAYKTIYWRFGVFYVMGALCVGIVVPYTNPDLSGTSASAAGSPYVIAMKNLGVSILPDIVNALLLTTIFSAGNTYVYAATRSLYGLSLEGRAPRVLQYTTKAGVPIWCFCVVMIFPFLAFLQLGNSSSEALDLLLGLITGGGVINYIIIGITYLRFYQACKVQGIDRRTFPYYGYFQPYAAWVAVIFESLVIIFMGYMSIVNWSIKDFFTYYTMALLAIVLYTSWKVIHRRPFVKSRDADLVWERPLVEAYEATLTDEPSSLWRELLAMVGIKKFNRRKTSVHESGSSTGNE
jgi:yeast amino acid transporter